MSSLVLSALLICFLIPIHGITACQLALRKLSAADVNTLLILLPPPQTIAHMALEDCPPRTKEWGVSVEDEQPNIPVTMGRVAGRFN